MSLSIKVSNIKIKYLKNIFMDKKKSVITSNFEFSDP